MKPTWDHALQSDGVDDEIYMQGWFSWLNPDGTVRVGPKYVRSPVYGQRRAVIGSGVVPVWTMRVERGSASPWGGITTGDWAPAIPPWNLRQQWHWPRPGIVETPLPIVVWEWVGPSDQLTGSILFTPSCWEYDNGVELDTAWGNDAVRFMQDASKVIQGAGGAVDGHLAACGDYRRRDREARRPASSCLPGWQRHHWGGRRPTDRADTQCRRKSHVRPSGPRRRPSAGRAGGDP